MGRSDLREGVSEIHRDEAREVCIVGGGKRVRKKKMYFARRRICFCELPMGIAGGPGACRCVLRQLPRREEGTQNGEQGKSRFMSERHRAVIAVCGGKEP